MLTKEIVLEKLKVFEDEKFKFYPDDHIYKYEEDQYISVTTLVGKLHKEFDKNGKSMKKALELGITQQEVLDMWQETNDRSNFIGTYTHEWIEYYYNKVFQELPIDEDIIDRINKFNIIHYKELYKLEPVKQETRIFSKKWKVAGTIDALFIYKGNLFIFDWKTNKRFLTDNDVDGRWEFLYKPFDIFYKNHLNEYSIQLHIYACILAQYGINVKACYLVYIGPNEPAKIYKTIDMREYVLDYFENYH